MPICRWLRRKSNGCHLGCVSSRSSSRRLRITFGNGAASYISRLLGQRNKDQANKVASTALYSSLVVGAIMIVLSILFLNPILRLLGATESVLPYAATYAGIYIVSCIFNVLMSQ